MNREIEILHRICVNSKEKYQQRTEAVEKKIQCIISHLDPG